VKLKNTLCISGLRNNLLSEVTFTDNGYSVTFKKYHAMINRLDGSVAVTAMKHNDLYIVNNKEEQAILASEKHDRNLIRWGQRYGHLNVN